jgi:Tyrosine phosphatase family
LTFFDFDKMERKIRSLPNFRDVGGEVVKLEDGSRARIRFGLMYRGASLDKIDARDVADLVQRCAVKTLIDLRHEPFSGRLGALEAYYSRRTADDARRLYRLYRRRLHLTSTSSSSSNSNSNVSRDKSSKSARKKAQIVDRHRRLVNESDLDAHNQRSDELAPMLGRRKHGGKGSSLLLAGGGGESTPSIRSRGMAERAQSAPTVSQKTASLSRVGDGDDVPSVADGDDAVAYDDDERRGDFSRRRGGRNCFPIQLTGTKFYFEVVSRVPTRTWFSAVADFCCLCNPTACKQRISGSVMNPLGLDGLYELFVEASKKEILAVLRLYTMPSNYPITVYCNHGKDRTGIIVALILAVCYVEFDSIVRNYSESFHNLAEWHKDIRSDCVNAGIDPDMFMTTPPRVMRNTILYIRREYGSVAQYLAEIGFSQMDQTLVRSILLEPLDARNVVAASPSSSASASASAAPLPTIIPITLSSHNVDDSSDDDDDGDNQDTDYDSESLLYLK